MKEGKLRNVKTKTNLRKKYQLDAKTAAQVLEELKQRTIAIPKKVNRYKGRIQ